MSYHFVVINKFAERVELLLKERGVTKYQLAKDTGISKSVISEYCKKTVQPTADNIIKIANYLDESTDFILGVIDESGRHDNNI